MLEDAGELGGRELGGLHDMLRAMLLACALTLGCHAIDYGIPRVNGECFAICTGDRVCNRQSGVCELNPCSAGCGEGRHCETAGAVPRCANDGEKFSAGAEPKG
ncbi:MAG TPA: hypothetical protein VFF12_19160 [Myxococcaceae bacterium]|nr:hypothetical protein [Myxococcaceae bacterium]